VYVCVYALAYTHAYAAQMGYLDVSPGVGMRHLEGPKSKWTKSRHTYIRIWVQSTHVYVYARRQDEILD